MQRIRVWLDDEPYELMPGARVVDLLAVAKAAGPVFDLHGNEIGSHGDLVPDQRLTSNGG
ncbi:MAG: hypothetical protein JWM80_4034 [Cyanobacteria bacterium RYN_339]|nr:hypothetical protein [Cyanobacteria bacterium RYN_339]